MARSHRVKEPHRRIAITSAHLGRLRRRTPRPQPEPRDTRELVGHGSQSTAEEARRPCGAARQAFPAWRDTPRAGERARV